MHRARIPLYLLALALLALFSAGTARMDAQAAKPATTVFEGARLIIGDGSAPIENSAFVVVGNEFTQVGRRGELRAPEGAAHVDLSGKTVMPALVDLHGHIGYQNIIKGTMSKAFYTRQNLIDHLQRLAYSGVSAIVSIADLEDRSDLHGGRTNWGRCSPAGAGGGDPQCCTVQDGGRGNRLAGIGSARRSLESGRSLSCFHGGGGSQSRGRLRAHEA